MLLLHFMATFPNIGTEKLGLKFQFVLLNII
jgi:hypothetical protein